MAAITAAVTRAQRNVAGKTVADVVITTAQTVYAGELVNFVVSASAPARVRAATAAASRVFAGVVEVGGTGNTAGSVTARIAWGHEVKIACTTALTTAYVGCNCAISTNNDVITASGAGTAGVQVIVGEVTEKVSANVAWVHLRHNAVAGNV